jgi:hypothetical protein
MSYSSRHPSREGHLGHSPKKRVSFSVWLSACEWCVRYGARCYPGKAAVAEQAGSFQIGLSPLYVAICQTPPQFRPCVPAFSAAPIPVTIRIHAVPPAGPGLNRFKRQRIAVADTTKIEDRQERKKLKRSARKKAAPKAKRTAPRGSNKKKLKKMVRGVSKR